MKLTSEIKPTPTFKQYTSNPTFTEGSRHAVTLVLANPDWRTITFFSEEFKLNFKLATSDEYVRQTKAVGKILTKHCNCYLEVESKTVCHLHLLPASDADESAIKFASTDRGWELS